jgi:hypothetical protein
MLTQYTAQATKPGYSAPLYRAYRAVAGGTTEQGVVVPPDPFELVTARVEEELKSPLQNMLGVSSKHETQSVYLNVLLTLPLVIAGRLDAATSHSDAGYEGGHGECTVANGPDHAREQT